MSKAPTHEASPPSPLRRALPALLVIVAALAAHARTLENGFTYDDRFAVQENPMVQGGFDPGALLGTDYWGQLPGQGPGTWRPLASLDLWLDWHAGGGRAWVFHLHNLLWHALACLLLVIALRTRDVPDRSAWAAGIAFAFLAVSTEAVASVVARADLMAMAFTLLAWAILPPPRPGLIPWRQIALAGSAFGAALLCKESALTALIWVPLADWLLTPAASSANSASFASSASSASSALRARLVAALALVAPALIALLARTILFGPPSAVLATANNNVLVGEPWTVRLLTSLALLLRAVRLLLVPLNLSADYSYAEILPSHSPLDGDVLVGLALAMGLVGALLWLRRRAPLLALASLILLVGWTAMSHVVVPLPTLFAERLLYLPATALALGAAQALFPWRSPPARQPGAPPSPHERRWPRRLARGAAVALLAANALRGAVRDGDWRDDLTLFRSATRVSPRSARAWLNLGAALQRNGRHPRALRALDRAAAIAPRWAAAHTLRGVSLFRLGRLREAAQEMRLAVRLDPTSRRAARNLAVLRGAIRDLHGGQPRPGHPPREP